MMRLSLIVSVVSMLTLAACAEAPKAPATPVQANQATAPAATGTADAAPQARARKKYCSTSSRICPDSPDNDPSLGGPPAGGLNNATSNATGGSPH
jgi:hypothetical protein